MFLQKQKYQRKVEDNPLIGQDAKTDMKAKNQDYLETMTEEYLRTLRHFEVFKNGSGESTHWKPSNLAKSEVRFSDSNGQNGCVRLGTSEMS